ncbi:hypothetical protein BDK51DRAFT_50180 [Blyttiomyces helicus]|uniref:Uncharacterized protein n=1 Tax=Blyttiomyces helicus TaxID=388810 RepID=A0A4P9VY28_9FUNG|nr:hypothetical protein BDK51DRAFT_50180 [Blyttiomyces helicus]|eukprot:RKO83210.1 hypothetical protein BDK51DRAFT_50180 [Blyttiomyces helicus]
MLLKSTAAIFYLLASADLANAIALPAVEPIRGQSNVLSGLLRSDTVSDLILFTPYSARSGLLTPSFISWLSCFSCPAAAYCDATQLRTWSCSECKPGITNVEVFEDVKPKRNLEQA